MNIAKLIDKEIDQTFDEIELQTFDPEYKDFYKLNISKISNYKKFVLTNKPEVLNSLDPEYDFVVPVNTGISIKLFQTLIGVSIVITNIVH